MNGSIQQKHCKIYCLKTVVIILFLSMCQLYFLFHLISKCFLLSMVITKIDFYSRLGIYSN